MELAFKITVFEFVPGLTKARKFGRVLGHFEIRKGMIAAVGRIKGCDLQTVSWCQGTTNGSVGSG